MKGPTRGWRTGATAADEGGAKRAIPASSEGRPGMGGAATRHHAAVVGRFPRGFSFVELVIAVAVAAILLGALLWWMARTREGGSRAIEYLRALEIAHESLEWIQATPLTPAGRRSLEAQSGSLVDAGTGRGIALNTRANPVWPETKAAAGLT